jgi:hypothetical protein
VTRPRTCPTWTDMDPVKAWALGVINGFAIGVAACNLVYVLLG